MFVPCRCPTRCSNVWSEKYDQRDAVPWTSDSSAEELGANGREQEGSVSFEVPDTPFQKF